VIYSKIKKLAPHPSKILATPLNSGLLERFDRFLKEMRTLYRTDSLFETI